MTACNERPPEGHPFHGTGIACHHAAGHLERGEAHSWDIEAARARAEIVSFAIERIVERYGEIDTFDVGLPTPIAVYDVDPVTGERAAKPYRVWDQAAGPWLLAGAGGKRLAIWKRTGAVYEVGEDGAVGEDPVIRGALEDDPLQWR